MAGAIAGTSILQSKKTNILDTITLTINNMCNLACGHCYMQIDEAKQYIDEQTLEQVKTSSAKRIVIAGQEIGVNIKKSSEILYSLLESGKEISVITNGLTLDKFHPELLQQLSYIDISMDGGPKTYPRSNYQTLLKNIKLSDTVNILHTLYDTNIQHIDDMLEVPGNIIMFSPYLDTKHHGTNTVERVPLTRIINEFSKSNIRDHENALLLIDTYHVGQDKATFADLENQVLREELGNNILFIKEDPLQRGVVRVTYDGKIMTPADSLHVANYRKKGMKVEHIDQQYQQLLKQ